MCRKVAKLSFVMTVVRRCCWQFHLKTFPVFIESLENNAQYCVTSPKVAKVSFVMSVVRRYCCQFHLKTFPVFTESLENNAQAYDATASFTGATIL